MAMGGPRQVASPNAMGWTEGGCLPHGHGGTARDWILFRHCNLGQSARFVDGVAAGMRLLHGE